MSRTCKHSYCRPVILLSFSHLTHHVFLPLCLFLIFFCVFVLKFLSLSHLKVYPNCCCSLFECFSIKPGHVSTNSFHLSLSPVAVLKFLVEVPKFLDTPDMKMLWKCVIYDSWDLNVSLQWNCVAIKTLDLWF